MNRFFLTPKLISRLQGWGGNGTLKLWCWKCKGCSYWVDYCVSPLPQTLEGRKDLCWLQVSVHGQLSLLLLNSPSETVSWQKGFVEQSCLPRSRWKAEEGVEYGGQSMSFHHVTLVTFFFQLGLIYYFVSPVGVQALNTWAWRARFTFQMYKQYENYHRIQQLRFWVYSKRRDSFLLLRQSCSNIFVSQCLWYFNSLNRSNPHQQTTGGKVLYRYSRIFSLSWQISKI